MRFKFKKTASEFNGHTTTVLDLVNQTVDKSRAVSGANPLAIHIMIPLWPTATTNRTCRQHVKSHMELSYYSCRLTTSCICYRYAKGGKYIVIIVTGSHLEIESMNRSQTVMCARKALYALSLTHPGKIHSNNKNITASP